MGKPVTALDLIQISNHQIYLFKPATILQKKRQSKQLTYLYYLAHQGGGLSDQMFLDNPFQSNRSRNWFSLDWFLYNFKVEHSFNKESNLSFNFFGLDAQRNSIGFRSNFEIHFKKEILLKEILKTLVQK